MTAELDASKLPEHWAEALAKRGFDQGELGTLVADIYDKSPVTVFPERSDLFRAFHLVDAKVLSGSGGSALSAECHRPGDRSPADGHRIQP